jgi:hypothetical protein
MIQLGFSAPEPFQGPRVANGLFKVEAGSLITVENRRYHKQSCGAEARHRITCAMGIYRQ